MFGIGMGPSKQENSQYNNLNASSAFATGLGESDLTASSKFMTDILSGDPTKVATALAPQINQQQQRTQQAKDTTAQFGPRSGGTAATVANMGAADRASTTDLVGSLTGKAASDLGSEGSNLLNSGISEQEYSAGLYSQLMQASLQQNEALAGSIGNFSSSLLRLGTPAPAADFLQYLRG